MVALRVEDLDKFVDSVERLGFAHPDVVAKFPSRFEYLTRVDQTIDPFSEHYYSQQVALYEEISNKKLNQVDGELHPVDINLLLTAPNPLGIPDVGHVSEHVRALSAMLSISGLGQNAKVLDMGAGHGLSSEVFAFSGCQVHAVDIDPLLSQLSIQRSATRHLGITRSTLNFDDLSEIPSRTYQAAYFFQSLHHCLRPWLLIAALKEKIVADGVIGFTGEPIQTHWWNNWGIRLDHESLFVARARGWFESGWSHQFIRECFKRSGFKLMFFSGGHAGGEIGIASLSQERLDKIAENAAKIGHLEVMSEGSDGIAPQKYLTQIGESKETRGYSTLPTHNGGYLCYGPYLKLKPGRYSVGLTLMHNEVESSHVIFDLVSEGGTKQHFQDRIDVSVRGTAKVYREFHIVRETASVEARVLVVGSGNWYCTMPEIKLLA